MGMAGGAFEGDMKRAELALRRQQAANQNAQAWARIDAENRARRIAQANAERQFNERMRQQDLANERYEREYSDRMADKDYQRDLAERKNNMSAEAAMRQKIFGDFDAAEARGKQQRADRRMTAQLTMASLAANAFANGEGGASADALARANYYLGMDGKTQGYTQAVMTKDGRLALTFASLNAQGQPQYKTEVVPTSVIGDMIAVAPERFGKTGIAQWETHMRDNGVPDSEISRYSHGITSGNVDAYIQQRDKAEMQKGRPSGQIPLKFSEEQKRFELMKDYINDPTTPEDKRKAAQEYYDSAYPQFLFGGQLVPKQSSQPMAGAQVPDMPGIRGHEQTQGAPSASTSAGAPTQAPMQEPKRPNMNAPAAAWKKYNEDMDRYNRQKNGEETNPSKFAKSSEDAGKVDFSSLDSLVNPNYRPNTETNPAQKEVNDMSDDEMFADEESVDKEDGARESREDDKNDDNDPDNAANVN